MKSRMSRWAVLLTGIALISCACERLDDREEDFPDSGESREPASVPLDEVAELFSEVPFGLDQMREVHNAVTASADNGYDEEYTLKVLFESPGTGVGDDKLETKAPHRIYERPMRDLLEEQLRARAAQTKASGGEPMDVDAYLEALQTSDAQIYWPYYENWDGEALPVITFDPGDNSANNVGYRLVDDGSGRKVEKVNVTEKMAAETPVWVINRNDDADYVTIDVLRKNDPDWGLGGSVKSSDTKAGTAQTLFLENLKMLRNYDCWFAGGSEFWIKAGCVEDFTASTDAEMRLYNPKIVDFMVVVRRGWENRTVPINTVLVSKWTDQLDKIAFMCIEDDGGPVVNWKASIAVKFKSKTYGIDVDLPIRYFDDIVWRGQIAKSYLQKYNGKASRFGDVQLTFRLE